MASKHKLAHFQGNTTDVFRLKPLPACVRMAIASGMFWGSVAPGFAELPVPAQIFVSSGAATNQVVGNTLEVQQQTDRAILNWESFNVGAKNQVDFQQPSSSSIALNRIFQNDPSQILGKVTANGQIYLYNQNGFVFGKNSTVDVNTLVATALDVSDDVIKNGSIVTEFDNNHRAAFSGHPDANAAIQVEAGANIKVAENGRLLLTAPNINNAGNLEADKYGQILLVASKDKVYLQPADAQSPFAGLLVEVDTGGKVVNTGEILSRLGNTTLAGFAVNQEGRVSATTSVSVNGSIRLLAREGHGLDGDTLVATRTTRNKDLQDGLGKESTVSFAPGSVTEIVADADGGAAIDEQTQPKSYLEVSANTVHLQSGSAIGVPGGQVNITATNSLLDPSQGRKGSIVMDEGAVIDVSGTKNIAASVERNVVDLPVQSFELRDSPYQKGGVLQGQTIKVDVRQKNPIVDISGALARVSRGIDERLGTGGTVNLTSSGDVVVNRGASVNISGGSINYSGGYINTTKLLTDFGAVVDIADANPNQHYSAIFGTFTESNSKWGTSQTWDNGLAGKGRYEAGYQQGLAAGSLNVETSKLLWNGDLVAGAASGLYQRTQDTLPSGGTLAIDTLTFNLAQGSSGQDVVFGQPRKNIEVAAGDPFPTRKNGKPVDLRIAPDLFTKSGLQTLSIKTLGKATIGSSETITTGANGQLALAANQIEVAGSIYAPGGNISLSSGFVSGSSQPAFNTSAQLTLAATAKIDVSGRWVNDFVFGGNSTPTEAIAINAGSVNLAATGNLTTAAGSSVQANGGAWYSQNQTLTAGDAGSITLASVGGGGISTALQLNGKLAAFGIDNGGSLTLSSGKIVIGTPDEGDSKNNPLVLDEQSGFNLASLRSFGTINLTSNFGDLIVKGQTSLNLVQQNLFVQGDLSGKASARSVLPFADVVTLPENLRNPVNLNLTANNNIKLETGSKILADKQASVSLTSNVGGIYVDGLIDAPAGSINLTTTDAAVPYNASQAIWLGSNGQLLVAGTTRMNPVDGRNLRTGEVLDGGMVTMTAKRGYIVLEQGSKIDVSGTKATLDIIPEGADSGNYVATEVGSNAGKIQLTAAEGAVLDGSFKAVAGTATTKAGSFDLALDRVIRNPPLDIIDLFPAGPLTLNVQQHSVKTLGAGTVFGDNLDRLGLNGKALVSTDKLTQAGFSDVRLATFSVNKIGTLSENSSVNFLGDVNFTAASSITLDSPNIGWQSRGAEGVSGVNLNTAYFSAGSSLLRETKQLPVAGTGQFTVHSQWTQLQGESRWNGFSTINLNSQHDLRAIGVLLIDGTADGKQNSDYRGEMVTAANLNLTASQVYPSTLSKFTFAVENNPNGKITVASSSYVDNNPLSAAGELTLQAPVIAQNGVLKAPFGNINLTADKSLTLGSGSLTSVSGAGQLIPFGVTYSGLDWLYPIDPNNILVFNAPPEKKLRLSAPQVVLANGSTVDLSGGGDLLAYEFQPGIGGSYDFLAPDSPSYQGGFAVVPNLGSALAPYDHLQQGNYQAVGSQIYLSGTDSLPAGFYTVLPARYALLPGAFLVTPVAGSQDQSVATRNDAGLPIIPGYQAMAGTGTKDARWSGYLIEDGADIRKHSQYDEQTANAFFTQRAIDKGTAVPLLPMDSGQISIENVQTKLSLEGDLKVASAGGRGARMDIAADRLRIVRQLSATPTAGTLEILADDLTGLHVDSLLLGGQRSIDQATGATELNVTSTNVTFAAGAQVQVSDLIAAATQKVTVEAGAKLTAAGTVNTGDSQLDINGDGALLRVSAADQVALNRTAAPGANGDLNIQAGSVLSASKSMLLDASHSTSLAGNIQMQGGSLNLSANAINLGEVAGASSTALNLSNEKLLSLAVDDLILNSRGAINIFGNLGQQDSSGKINPLNFNQLTLNAAGIVGFGGANQSANLKAQTLILENTDGATVSNPGKGQGQLNIFASNYQQGAGIFGISGFTSANISVDNGFTAVGKSTLNVNADLRVTSGYLTTVGGNTLAINAQGHQAQFFGNNSAALPELNYGGAIDILADAVDLNAKVVLPSGRLGLHGLKGDVLVGANAQLDLSGDAVPFADSYDYTPGGVFDAVSDQGKIILAQGSKLDLNSGGGSAAGGKLLLRAVKQDVELLGQITASSGSVVYDVAKFSDKGGFDSLIAKLSAAGISDSVYVRTRAADIEQTTGGLKANTITLVADQGAITISGKLNADGVPASGQAQADGGAVSLYAGDKVTLNNGAAITAKGSGGDAKGGRVVLSSTDVDNDHNSGIDIQAGSVIDVHGGNAANGKVLLRALRADSNQDGVDDSLAIQPVKGKVTGFGEFYAEGVKKYGNQDLGNDGGIDPADIAKMKADTDAYMTATTVRNVAKLDSELRLRPGIEIDYQGDLTLKTSWDLVDWRYPAAGGTGVPGGLSINASGSLSFPNSLTDGFRTASLVPGSPIRDLLQTDDSWSYQLAAGADLTSADKTAGGTSQENLTVGKDTVIRTGTGDITLSASGDVVFQDATSAVYSAGKAQAGKPYGAFGDIYVGFKFYGEYPLAGGDLTINAGGDIKGALNQAPFINNWLVRLGGWQDRFPTAWGIDFAQFDQNVGSFGGGKVTVNANGNIDDLAVALPTTGKQVGQISDPNDQFSKFKTNEVVVGGGGELQVNAGGDIAGGVYYLGQGDGRISAAGSITGSSHPEQFSSTVQGLVDGPQFLMGDTRLAVNANNGIKLSAVSDPMILHDHDVNFFSYSSTSALRVKSLAGDVQLNSDASVITSTFQATGGQINLAKIYPASLAATAFGGSVLIGGTDTDIILYPSAQGNLNVFAKANIAAASDGVKRLGMSDFDPALLPNYLQPFSAPDLEADKTNISSFLNPFSTDKVVHAQRPLHGGDAEPVRLATSQGDIASLIVDVPKKAVVQSGRDLANVSLTMQHADLTGDASVISAARDIIYQVNRSPDFGTLEGNTNKIEVGGTGDLLVKAGRNIDLGTSIGLSSVGNWYNPNLSDSGANITVLAGLNGAEPDYLGLFNLDPGVLKYAQNYNQYQQIITQFMRDRTGNTALTTKTAFEQFNKLAPSEYAALQPKFDSLISHRYDHILAKIQQTIIKFFKEKQGVTLNWEEAKAAFQQLAPQRYLSIQPRLNTLANRILFSELNQTGSASASDPTLGNERGFAAINALYPLDRLYNLLVNQGNVFGNSVDEIAQSAKATQQALVGFIQQWSTIDGSVSANNLPAAIARFAQLTPEQYLAIQAQLADSQKGISPTYLAVQPINPKYLGHQWQGDISLYFSKVQTLKDGSINLLAPGGQVNAGLAVVSTDLQKAPSDLGIVVQGAGDINAFVNNDFIVNQSRVFALGGGDISIWSSIGNIDAGRGAKSAIAAPPPIISFDQSGNLVITFPPVVSGSGIRTAAPVGQGIPPGNVALFAPGGIVNAGEAGIAGKNVTISATAVLGANNIQVGGIATGVPASSTSSIAAGLTGVSNLTASVSQVAQASADMSTDKDDSGATKNMKLGTLSVDVIGFGDNTGGDEDHKTKRR